MSPPIVGRFERDGKLPGYNNLQAIRSVLVAAGVEFIGQNGGGSGARLRKTRKGDKPGELVFSPELCRAARNLVAWSQIELADAAGLVRSTVAEFERNARETSPKSLAAMQSALEDADVIFIAPNGGGPGVRLKT